MTNRNYTFINLLKTTAMFMVINYHCILFFSGDPYWAINADYTNSICSFLANFFSLCVNAVFVFTSGFLLEVTLAKKEYKTFELIKKKGKRFIKTYFVYGILWLVPTYTLFNIPSYGRPENSSLLEGYKANLLGRFGDVSWFLLMLFWVTLIFILIRKYTKKDKLLIGTILTIVIMLFCKYALANVDYYKISQVYPYVPVYFAGIIFYHFIDKIDKLKSLPLLVISIVGIIACMFLSQLSSTNIHNMMMIASPLFLSLLAILFSRYVKVENRIVNWIIKNNMYIYLLQMPGLYVAYDFIYPIIGQKTLLCVLSLYVITIVQDYILVQLLNIIIKYLNKLKTQNNV